MSSRWAEMHNYPFPDHHDLPRVMQYISISDGDAIFVKERVCEEFASRGNPSFADATEPHALLANFPVRVFITTNYDDFLTKALKIAGKSPRTVVCPWYLPGERRFHQVLLAGSGHCRRRRRSHSSSTCTATCRTPNRSC